MKRLLAAVALGLFALVGVGSSPASAAVSLCHGIHVVVNGSDVVNEAGCNSAP